MICSLSKPNDVGRLLGVHSLDGITFGDLTNRADGTAPSMALGSVDEAIDRGGDLSIASYSYIHADGAAGQVPVAARDPTGVVSAVDGAVYLVEGDYADAALCFVGAIPGVGKVEQFATLFQRAEKVASFLCQAKRWGNLGVSLWKAGQDAAKGNWAMAGLDLGVGIIGFLTGGCFAAGTQVVIGIDPVTGNYITKNIEDLKVGDQVLSRSESDPDGPLEYQSVTQTFTQVVNNVRAITVRNSNGTTEVIHASDQHPFYVQGVQANDGFVEAAYLQTGMTLVDANGAAETIIGISDEDAPAGTMVYNLELSGDHTYFVLDQNGDAVWGHNGCKVGAYEDVGGHHIFSKAAFFGSKVYDEAKALAVPVEEILARGGRHIPDMNILQRQLFDKLAEDVAAGLRVNSLAEHAAIAKQVLKDAGKFTSSEADTILGQAIRQLRSWERFPPESLGIKKAENGRS